MLFSYYLHYVQKKKLRFKEICGKIKEYFKIMEAS